MHDFDRMLDACFGGRGAALATVVRTSGATYRRPGARMVVTHEGEVIGALSGGCLEDEVAKRAIDVLDAGHPSFMRFDTRLSLGCDGVVDILVERVPLDLADSLARRRITREPFVMATVFLADTAKGPALGSYCIDARDNETLPAEMKRDARISLAAGRPTCRTYPWGECFFDVVLPPTRLVIIGGSYDVVPLAHVAIGLGWDVRVITHPGSAAPPENLSARAECIVAGPEALEDRVRMDAFTAVVVMTHHFGRDLAYLDALLPLPLPFLGLMGPRKRREQMLAALLESRADAREGFDSESLSKLRSPVGLDIGAESPEEIALSIAAEIQAALTNRTGKPLRDCQGPIHDKQSSSSATAAPSASRAAAIVLAAGGSRRLGHPKQMVRYQGRTLIRRAAETALESGCWPVVVVLGAAEEECARELSGLPVRLVSNPNWPSGIASSIRSGLDASRHLGVAPPSAMICLCDQPHISADMLRAIMKTHHTGGARIVASEFDGILGAPALFHSSLFDELLALSGDEGARRLFTQFADEVAVIPHPAAALDVDTPADHHRLVVESHLAAAG